MAIGGAIGWDQQENGRHSSQKIESKQGLLSQHLVISWWGRDGTTVDFNEAIAYNHL